MSASEAARETDPLVGQVVQGRFRVISRIAAGGMGVVFKAEQIPLGRVVALKVLESKQSPTVDESFSRRFFLEASAASKLAHPNTIVVHDYGKTEDGLFFIAMEHLDGGCLGTRLKKQGPLTPAQAIHVGLQVAGSLGDAHAQGLVHRDLKPGNVMFAPRGGDPYYVKVLDFGLVKVLGQGEDENLALTRSGVMMGSPRYMAPEQVKAQQVDHRADIYAFGAMLYHMVAGAPPFAAGSAFEAMHAHVNIQPPPLKSTWPGCPAGPNLEHVIMRCLAKEPAARFATMHELMMALRACQAEAGPFDGAAGGWQSQSHGASLSLASSSQVSSSQVSSNPGSSSQISSSSDSNPSISRSGVTSRSNPKTMRFEAPAEAPPSAPAAVASRPKRSGMGLGVKLMFGLVAAFVVAGGALAALWIAPRLRQPTVPTAPVPTAEARAPSPPPVARSPVDAPLPAVPAPVVEAPAAPVDPAPVVAAQIVPLMLETDPPTATVQRDGRDLGDTPVPLLIPRGERWTIDVVKAGYVTRTVTVIGGQASLTLHLVPAPSARDDDRRRPPIATPQPQSLTPTPQPLAPGPAPRRRPGTYAPDLDDPWANRR